MFPIALRFSGFYIGSILGENEPILDSVLPAVSEYKKMSVCGI